MLVKRGHKRCPLTASRKVSRSEVVDHIDVRELGQQGPIEQLGAVAPCVVQLGLMTDGLSMRTQGLYAISWKT